jgi:hypothetical protein
MRSASVRSAHDGSGRAGSTHAESSGPRAPLGIELAQEEFAPVLLVGLPEFARRPTERVERAKESPIGLMAPSHVARAPPTCGAQRIESAVVAHPGVRVALHRIVRQFCQCCPGLEATRIPCRHGRNGVTATLGRQRFRLRQRVRLWRGEGLEHGLGTSRRELHLVLGHLDIVRGPGNAPGMVDSGPECPRAPDGRYSRSP